MNSSFPTHAVLTGAWIALTTLASAQTSHESRQEPRVPRPPADLSLDRTDTATPPRADVDSSIADGLARSQREDATAAEPRERARETSANRVGVPISSTSERYARVHWDTDEHGAIWVRGRTYKARFGSEGATYFPLFGSNQPRHFPLELTLASATSAGQAIPLSPITSVVRDGERVVIERGVIDEVYEIGVEGVEQTFVISERPAGGLELVVGLRSEMTRGERADGFEFANEFGAVRYGRAFVREESGVKRALVTRLVAGGVQIDVEADYLASAQFPLTVDPLITTFDVDTTTFDNFAPDVAFDATTYRYLYVYEETVTATDHDVYSQVISLTGVAGPGAYVDSSTTDWRGPSVGNLNAYDQFLVAGSVGNVVGFSSRIVRGRTTPATGPTYGTVFNISTTVDSTGHKTNVSVGGDPFSGFPAYYCVAFEREWSPTDHDILARLVTNTGTLVGASVLPIANTSPQHDMLPSVSKGNSGIRWNIAWQRDITSTNGDIHAAQVEWDGSAITTPNFVVSAGSSDDTRPSASTSLTAGSYAVVWERYFATTSDHDIYAASITGGTVGPITSLSFIEGTTLFEDQREPAVDSDGQHFTVTYAETYLSSLADYDIYVSAFHILAGAIAVSEAHVPFAFLNGTQIEPTIVSQVSTGGTGPGYALGWTDATIATNRNIEGGLYNSPIGGPISSFCAGDGTGTACPCGNSGLPGNGCASSVNPNGANLSATGSAGIGLDSLVLSGSGMPNSSALYFQGTTRLNGGLGSLFGDGLRCAGGSIIRLGTKVNASGGSQYPAAGDPSISVRGLVTSPGTRTYQVWYRNAAVFCVSATFNLTNGLSVTWGLGSAPGMVAIPAGTFVMGSNAAGGAPYFGSSVTQPVHPVTISYSFWMGQHEVTQSEYTALMGTNPSGFPGANNPVEQVIWFDAQAYCAALTTQQSALGNVPPGYQYRLPTEAEWEYACRAGTTTEFNVGSALFCNQAKFGYSYHSNSSCGSSSTVPVGSYAPNAWGLYDMHGNAWEWCLDSHAAYSAGPVTDPFVTGGPYRVLRGGGWHLYSDVCRSADRDSFGPGNTGNVIGFRVVLAPVLAP